MFQPIFVRLFLLLFSFQLTHQTNIEFYDTPLPEYARVFQKCRFLESGDCCVPVDFILSHSNIKSFTPYKIVFEYFAKNALFVFADAENMSACRGPSVDGYRDPAAQLNVKDFVARPGQKFSGAMFTQTGGDIHVGRIRFPWSIAYEDIIYYQSPSNPLFYADVSGRYFLRAIPQFGKLHDFDLFKWYGINQIP